VGDMELKAIERELRLTYINSDLIMSYVRGYTCLKGN
jgi:hypothetical protein